MTTQLDKKHLETIDVMNESFSTCSIDIESQSQSESDSNCDEQHPSAYHRNLHSRHLQMIAIGSAIGSGIFVSSGSALSTAGPAALLIAWSIGGFLLYCTLQALCELVVTFPVSGGFMVYNTKFISPAWGFMISWNYVHSRIMSIPLELIALSITMQYWVDVNIAVWISVATVFLVIINLFGVRGYGEAECIFSCIKLLGILMFVIMALVLVCQGGTDKAYAGGKYWKTPGAFNHGFKGFSSILLTAILSYSGTEVMGLNITEVKNPRKAMPSATKQAFWRIFFAYIISITMITFLIPFNDRKLQGNSPSDSNASPFVIAAVGAGLRGLPSVMNAVILIAVFSVVNTSVFAASRAIVSLSQQVSDTQLVG
ncbi:unnamed protein product [Ambrosiozyma monospora]|uniref:Unnamed protein product n=1 Tax=Ambrosiozyma monospora TaxID=43982 RepID=A0ACB5TML2_AMBMO|nr:unnamed protein product [Ambrosiozyma monospora]